MVTENGRLAEVTEAAERMGIIPPLSREGKIFNPRGRGVSQRERTEAYWAIFSLWFLSVCLCARCGKILPIHSIQLLRHQFIH